MVSFTVRMKFEHEDQAEIAAILRKLTEETRKEEGCISYIPHFVEGEPCTVLLYEQYVNEAALDHHRASPHFQKYAAGGLYQKMLGREMEDLAAIC